MRSTQVLSVLAVLAASVSGMSIGHVSNEQVHRRHAAVATHDSVLQARGARQPSLADLTKRRDTEPRRVRKRSTSGRCAAKSQTTSSELPTSTPTAAVAVSVAIDQEPEPTTTSRAHTTTSSKADYTKTTTKATKTTTSIAPASTGDSGSSSGTTYTGEATYYGTGLGSCGITNVDTDYICAVSELLYDGFDGYTGGNPNSNPICGRKLTATYQGKTVSVTVTDRCVACAKYDLDFSPTAFEQLADQSLGRLTGMTWNWN